MSHIEKEIDLELGISYDDEHYSGSGHFGLSSVEELELGIERCKVLVLEAEEHSDKRRELVSKLVKLRLKLQEIREGTDDTPGVRKVLGHVFSKKSVTPPNPNPNSSKHYCERCNSLIWSLLQTWYRCRACGFCCHAKCLNFITRTCANVKVSTSPHYNEDICPEVGLSSQNYRCADCRAKISFDDHIAPRICDYSGLYYCTECHWNDVMVMPARVILNWDFTPRPVSRISKQYLKLMVRKPVLKLTELNPKLPAYVDELNQLDRLRSDILVMKEYFLTCKVALENRLLILLEHHQHFIESTEVYTLQELSDAHQGLLLPQLQHIHSLYTQHIKYTCETCKSKGFLCELCNSKEILFAFDDAATTCSQCHTVYHRCCFLLKFPGSPDISSSVPSTKCPKCERRRRRDDEMS